MEEGRIPAFSVCRTWLPVPKKIWLAWLSQFAVPNMFDACDLATCE